MLIEKKRKHMRRRQVPRQRTEGDGANASHSQGAGWGPQMPFHGHNLTQDWQVTVLSPSPGAVPLFLKL